MATLHLAAGYARPEKIGNTRSPRSPGKPKSPEKLRSPEKTIRDAVLNVSKRV